MTLLEHIKLLAQAYAKAKGIGIGRVSSLVFGDGNKLVLICQDRADLTTKRYEKAMVWFAENWPKGTDWPSGVPKPKRRTIRSAIRKFQRSNAINELLKATVETLNH